MRQDEQNHLTIARPSAVIESLSSTAPISFKKSHELERAVTLGGSIALPKNSYHNCRWEQQMEDAGKYLHVFVFSGSLYRQTNVCQRDAQDFWNGEI